MKRLSFILFLFIALFFFQELAAQQIRVACVGNSLTYGTGIRKRNLNAYPAQLQRLLGEAYLVRNFGLEGSVAYKGKDNSYFDSDQYKASVNFEPEIIVMSFGLEEAKALEGGELPESFVKDFSELVFRYFNLPSALRIIILSPAPSFDEYGILPLNVLKDQVIPAVEEVAYKRSAEMIDIFSPLSDDPTYFTDGINISAKGADRIARNLFEAISFMSEHDFNFLYELGIENSNSEYHGFNQSDFKLYGWDSKIVSPRRTAIGRPWLLHIGPWDAGTEINRSLLRQGFHIFHINTEELYGNSQALDRLDRLMELALTGSMAKEPVVQMYGIGAVAGMKWAIRNQKSIAAIHLSDPLLDLKSWPLGKYSSEKNEEASSKALKAYGIRNEKKMGDFAVSPVDYFSEWTGEVPIILESTPSAIFNEAENSQKLLKHENFNKSTTVINTLSADNMETVDPTLVANFFLNQIERKINFSTIPSAGYTTSSDVDKWASGTDWWDHHRNISDQMADNEPDIIFLSDQFFEGIGGRSYLSSESSGVFPNRIQGLTWINAGISGDRTEQMIYRVKDGEYKRSNARILVLGLSLENYEDTDASSVFSGISRLVQTIEKEMPDVKILLIGPIDPGNTNASMANKYKNIHTEIENKSWSDFVFYRPELSKAGNNYQKLASLIDFEVSEILSLSN